MRTLSTKNRKKNIPASVELRGGWRTDDSGMDSGLRVPGSVVLVLVAMFDLGHDLMHDRDRRSSGERAGHVVHRSWGHVQEAASVWVLSWISWRFRLRLHEEESRRRVTETAALLLLLLTPRAHSLKNRNLRDHIHQASAVSSQSSPA